MIDTHCHLDNEVFLQDFSNVLQEAESEGVDTYIIPGADIFDLPRAIELAEKHSNLYFASGVHPYHAQDFDWERIAQVANHPKCVAIGECGLDFFRLPSEDVEEYKHRQKECFITQIKLAISLDKPLILHVREASAEVAKILREYPKAYGVFHCYNADEMLLEFCDRFYYGIGGVLTFSNAKRLVNVLPKIPRDRVIVETDAPYLTPHPFRGSRNEPKYIPLIVAKIAEVLDLPIESLKEMLEKNTKTLFKFP
ncbi:hydrolase TatD [Helicobacter enhydrae]|uniref:Hydrolase TatD n=1 Tax=Helicobacter enhydrae TaxID=222136 RepID=A0A1B1U3Y2_9HELI|nr:TatD family hydrolase [Helicobacter enhydrae]ANV97494.1 hydrolase TatD [Helicobacter enhydrae]